MSALRAGINAGVRIVHNSLAHRWFLLDKPSGWQAQRSTGTAGGRSLDAEREGQARDRLSIEEQLEPFLPSRKKSSLENHSGDPLLPYDSDSEEESSLLSKGQLWWPSRPDKDAQGLVIACTDRAMMRQFIDFNTTGRIEKTYRLLLDLSFLFPWGGEGLEAKQTREGRPICGDLVSPDGRALNDYGVIRSYIARHPVKMRLASWREPGHAREEAAFAEEDEMKSYAREYAMRGGLLHPSREDYHAFQAARKRRRQKEQLSFSAVRDLLEGASVPSPFSNLLDRSLLHQSVPPESYPGALNLHVTEYEVEDVWERSRLAVVKARPLGPAATHQLRVHFSELGAPVMFDVYYHPQYSLPFRKKTAPRLGRLEAPPLDIPGLGRRLARPPMALQLAELKFPDPVNPKATEIQAALELPPDWELIRKAREEQRGRA